MEHLKVFTLLLLATLVAGQSDKVMVRPRTIIVGGGIAGLSAAAYLEDHGYTDYVILEASNRIGGRIKTIYLDDQGGAPIEIGAGWIHGTEDNPLYENAELYGLLDKEVWRESLEENNPRFYEGTYEARLEDSIIIPMEEWYPVYNMFDKANNKADLFFREGLPRGYTQNASVESYIVDRFYKKFNATSDVTKWVIQRSVLETLLKQETSDAGCHSMDEVSLQYYGSYLTLEGDDVPIPGGFYSVIDMISSTIPSEKIRLNHAVEKVKYSAEDSKVRVSVKNGRVYEGDRVIITASLGFLKDKAADMFDPPLTKTKMAAIDRMGFGTVAKIYLEFENLDFIHDEATGTILFVRKPSRSFNPNDWIKKVFACYVEPVPLANMLTCWLTGKEAEEMEQRSDEEVTSSMRNLLQDFLGTEVPAPVNMIRTRWHSDKYVKGSYSFIKVGSSIADVETLAEPVYFTQGNITEAVVLFAGEATHSLFYSTAHGAMLSGIREAKRITGTSEASETLANAIVISLCLAFKMLM